MLTLELLLVSKMPVFHVLPKPGWEVRLSNINLGISKIQMIFKDVNFDELNKEVSGGKGTQRSRDWALESTEMEIRETSQGNRGEAAGGLAGHRKNCVSHPSFEERSVDHVCQRLSRIKSKMRNGTGPSDWATGNHWPHGQEVFCWKRRMETWWGCLPQSR